MLDHSQIQLYGHLWGERGAAYSILRLDYYRLEFANQLPRRSLIECIPNSEMIIGSRVFR